LVIMGLEAETDQEAIGIMARMLYDQGYVKESYIQAVKEREKEFFTGLGFEEMGVAMPHTDAVHVNRQAIGIGILKKPVRFRTMGELDGALDVQLMFMLAINKPDKQLDFLSHMIASCQDPDSCINKHRCADFLSHMIDSCQKEGNLSGIYHAADPTEAAERFKKFF